MSVIEKINKILKETGISKVNLAKYLGVSRQMIYNYFDADDLSKVPADKCQNLFNLFNVKNEKELNNVTLTKEYLESVQEEIYKTTKHVTTKKEETIDLVGLKAEEKNLINDIVFILKEMLNEDKTSTSYTTLLYLYNFLQTMTGTRELKYILGYFSKAAGYTKPDFYLYDEDRQFTFESILYSAMTLYNNGGASKSKLAESHRRWEIELSRKNEEKLSRTQELNTAKVLALKELGYTEITEKNAGEVFDKIAEIQARTTI